jgi:hypothetical protein
VEIRLEPRSSLSAQPVFTLAQLKTSSVTLRSEADHASISQSNTTTSTAHLTTDFVEERASTLRSAEDALASTLL